MKVEKLNSCILARNAHKIKEYAGLKAKKDEVEQPGLIEKNIIDFDLDKIKASITTRNFSYEQNPLLYQEILLSSVEYFDLFIVNRPIQTLPGEVAVVKKMEQAFLNLQHNITAHKKTMTNKITERQTKEFGKVSVVMDDIILHAKLTHRKGVDRVRRAYRSVLHSIYAKISLEAKNDLERMLSETEEKHITEIKEFEEGILEMKMKSLGAVDERTRAVTQLAKYQLQVKRNGLVDNEAFSVNDEKVRPDGLIDYFHSAINSREERKRELTFNINVLEIVNSCLDVGMHMSKIPGFISGGEPIGILKRKLVKGTETGIDLTKTSRTVENYTIPLNVNIEMIENRLMDIVDDIEENARIAIEDKQNEIKLMNAKYRDRFKMLEEKMNQAPSINVAKKWDVKRLRHGMATKTSCLIDRMASKTEDKIMFCDLNGPAEI